MPSRRFEHIDPELKKRLLEAASDEFAGHGFNEASLNRIIHTANISKGSFYYYFEDKVDLYVTTVRHALSGFGHLTDDFLCDRIGGGFWEGLRTVFRRAFEEWVAQPRLIKLLRGGSPLLRKVEDPGPVAELFSEVREMTAAILKKGMGAGAIRTDLPMDLLVDVVYAMGEAMDMFLLNRWSDFAGSNVESLVDIYEDLFRRVAAPPSVSAVG